MTPYFDPIFWFYMAILTLWIQRAVVAYQTLKKTPSVSRIKFDGLNTSTVTVVIPAKNEERNIESCLNHLQKQDYPHLQILVVNDGSSDKTEIILKTMGVPNLQEEETTSTRIGYINGTPTPEGWTGKNHALHQATPYIEGDWILFTDADTQHTEQSISSAIAHCHKHQLKTLTLFPKCVVKSWFESLMQPLAMAYMGLWFPSNKINDPNSEIYFGNGQYLLMEKRLYKEIGGHESVKDKFLEDFAFLRKVKQMKVNFQVALGTDIYGTRMYDEPAALWRGWRRILLHAFNQKKRTLLLKSANLLFFSCLPFLFFIPLASYALQFPGLFTLSFSVASLSILLILLTTYKGYKIIKGPEIFAILHPIAALILSLILLDAYWIAARKLPTKWR